MPELQIGDIAPDFVMPSIGPDMGEKTLSKADFVGGPFILYFYPRDATPGCTSEACDFRDNFAQFNKLGAKVLGVSKDNIVSHDKFIKKHELNFPLAYDKDGQACEAYGTWIEKSMYGRKYMGIDRATFLIDAQGRIAGIWRKVKVGGHVAELAKAIKALEKAAA